MTGLVPRDHAPTVRHLAREIDRVLAGFVRGQVSVCALLGTFYAVALMLAGLQFGLIVGQLRARLRLFLTLGRWSAARWRWGWRCSSSGASGADWHHRCHLAAGQFIEGNILTPKLVGKSVGLHPVWLLLALSAFGRSLALSACWWRCRWRRQLGC